MGSAAPRLAAYYFAYFAYAGAMLPYFALYLDAVGLGAAQIALVLAMPQFARIFAPAFWGWLADRSGARRGIVIGAGVAQVIGLAVLYPLRDPVAIAVLMILVSVLSAGAMPIVESIALNVLGGQTGRYGPVRLWGSVSFILAVLGTGIWLDTGSPLSIVAIVWSLALLTLIAAFGVPAGVPGDRGSVPGSIAAVLRRPEVRALFGACFFMAIAHGALYTFYSIYLAANGYSKTMIGVLWTLGVLAEILVFFKLPQLMRRFSLRGLLLLSFLVAGVRFVLIGWGVESLAILLLAQCMHAATFGVYHAASVAAVHRLFSGAVQARGQALYTSLSYGLGGATGTLLAGWSWERLGSASSFGLSALAALLGGALVLRWVRT